MAYLLGGRSETTTRRTVRGNAAASYREPAPSAGGRRRVGCACRSGPLKRTLEAVERRRGAAEYGLVLRARQLAQHARDGGERRAVVAVERGDGPIAPVEQAVRAEELDGSRDRGAGLLERPRRPVAGRTEAGDLGVDVAVRRAVGHQRAPVVEVLRRVGRGGLAEMVDHDAEVGDQLREPRGVPQVQGIHGGNLVDEPFARDQPERADGARLHEPIRVRLVVGEVPDPTDDVALEEPLELGLDLIRPRERYPRDDARDP